MAASLVRDAHTHTHTYTRTRTQAESKLSSCRRAVSCCPMLCCPPCYANDQSGRSALKRTESKVPLAGLCQGPACCYAAS